MKRFLSALITVVLLTGVATAAFAIEEKTYQAVSQEGVRYRLTVRAPDLELMKPLPVSLELKTADGAPVVGARLSCCLTMPAMAMPNNNPPLKEMVAAGRYEGVFLLTMGGLWHVELKATYADGRRDEVVIPITGVAGVDEGVNAQLEGLFKEKQAAGK